MQLKTIDFFANFDEYVTGNALRQLETILGKFARICATGNSPLQSGTILCNFGHICDTGNCQI